MSYPTFYLTEFPGEAPNNYLVFKGAVPVHSMRMQYPIKYILPTNYPLTPPKIYFDFQLSMEIVKSLDYIGFQNALTF